ncbi:MAG: radical SAM protein [Sellimonas intestinalis]
MFSEDNCKKLDAMTWEQIQQTFYNCLDFCKVYDRFPYFYLTGGDPILHPNFWKLLALMKEHQIPFTILGNPFHLNDETCRRMKEYGCEKCQLSLDGMRKTHDWFRKPGSFDITLEKIDCLRRAGIRSVIMTTVSGTNIDEIPDIIDIVVKLTMRTCSLSQDIARPVRKRKWGLRLFVIEAFWKNVTGSSRCTRHRGAIPILIKRIISGRCMSMRQDSFRFLRTLRMEWFTEAVIVETAI